MAVEILEVTSGRGKPADEFVAFPHRLYRGTAQWVPLFRREVRAMLDRRNPFFRTAQASFLVARRGRETVGTIAAFDNVRYNRHHGSHLGHFHFFECREDPQAASDLFGAAFGWMRDRGLTEVRGPYGFGSMGTGVLIEGFEHRAAMTMMGWNYPYYRDLVEAAGLVKHEDLFSFLIDPATFTLPDKVRRVAEIALRRGAFRVPDLRTKRELRRLARDVGRVYNESFASHGDSFVPLSEEELSQVTSDLTSVADPALIKLLFHGDELAGFVFGFPDLSAALQRARGRMAPWNLLDLLLEYRRADRLIVNGAGVAPKYQRLGGTALLYLMLERIARQRRFRSVDCVQIAETTTMMLADIATLGGRRFKVHRVYRRAL